LHLEDVELALGFVVLLAEAVCLLLLRVKLDPVTALNVFLDFHTHDIGVDRQLHFVGH